MKWFLNLILNILTLGGWSRRDERPGIFEGDDDEKVFPYYEKE